MVDFSVRKRPQSAQNLLEPMFTYVDTCLWAQKNATFVFWFACTRIRWTCRYGSVVEVYVATLALRFPPKLAPSLSKICRNELRGVLLNKLGGNATAYCDERLVRRRRSKLVDMDAPSKPARRPREITENWRLARPKI